MTNAKDSFQDEIYIKVTDLKSEEIGVSFLKALADESLSFEAKQVYYCLLHYPLSSKDKRTLSEQVNLFLDVPRKEFQEYKKELIAAGYLKEGRL
ncbi:hypothetical protein WN59_06680 [Salinicoccus sediminis]|uniref:Uncharacterized protein n=1 Tax=Salinicoccus sediminis TaxID=1432562 RepID=A0A0M2SM23_9STAP|nr:hypothetical protein [Salinicoccus sediminis]KKK34711.1 hypothetical protein WN59_06680 [Salinicoccus sediminis]